MTILSPYYYHLSSSSSTFLTLLQPESSGLHVHPLTEAGSELGDQISVISSEKQKKGGGLTHQLSDVSRFASAGWHADITFEPVPSDYAMLKIHTLPATGGDTVRSQLGAKHLSLADTYSSFGRLGTRSMTASLHQ
jgi:alpha-ketoglutarate-dependent taurine dioxygenase